MVAVAAKTTIQLADLRMLRRITLGEQGADGFHRSWIMLFPEGKFKHPDYGTLNFTHTFLSEIKQHFDDNTRGIEIALDQNHDKNQATGWLEQLQIRPALGDTPAGLWAQVRWTPLGVQLLQEQRYRYFSPEFGPDKNARTGKTTNNVLLGGGLTNRPFLKEMDAVTLSELAETSNTAWGSVDKTKLPDSAFLDPKNRRLPIYEGTGPLDADGKYTQRGPLNLNGLTSAYAAINGAHTGKGMTGLPAGVRDKIQSLRNAHGLATDDDSSGGGSASEGAKGGGKSMARRKLADGEDQSDVDDSSSMDDGTTDDGGSDDSFDDGSDTHGAMTTDGHMHGKYAEHSHDGDGDHSDAPLAKQMSIKKAHEKFHEARTLAEANRKMAEQEKALAELNYKFYTSDMSAKLESWFRGEMQFSETSSKAKKPEGGKVTQRHSTWALSPKAQDAVKAYFLSERGYQLDEEDRSDLAELIETVAKGVVDLSVRGGSRDTDAGKTLSTGRPRDQHADDALQSAVEEYLSEKGVELSELRADLASTDRTRSIKAGQLIEQAQRAAAQKINYEGIVH